jgi:hypothetical protein
VSKEKQEGDGSFRQEASSIVVKKNRGVVAQRISGPIAIGTGASARSVVGARSAESDTGHGAGARSARVQGEPDKATERTLRIFLASSSELRADRDAFDLYFRQQNDRLRTAGRYLEIVRWENFLDAMSETRLQDEYNRKIVECDVFVSLFLTKTGRFTEEEFDVAHSHFAQTGSPRVYTFFKDTQLRISSTNRTDLESLWRFQDKLKQLGHFWTQYDGIEQLKLLFRDQLDKLFAAE